MNEGVPLGTRDAEKIAELARGDEQRGAGGESDDHGVGHEIDERPEAGHAQAELEQAARKVSVSTASI